MSSNKTQKQMIEELMVAVKKLQSKSPYGEMKFIQAHLENLDETVIDIKAELLMMRKKLFNPEDGVIVRVNKNTERMDDCEAAKDSFLKLDKKVDGIKRFKDNSTKALWVLYTALLGLIIKLLFFS